MDYMLDSPTDSITQPWQVMPAQVAGRPKTPCSEPVRHLMVAILEDALRVLVSPIDGGKTRDERRSAWQWLQSTDRSYVFAFERICEVLNFEPSAMRVKVASDLTEWSPRRTAALRAAAA